MIKKLLLVCVLLASAVGVGQTHKADVFCRASSATSCNAATVSVVFGDNAVFLLNDNSASTTLSITDTNSDSFTDCGAGKVVIGSYSYQMFCGVFLTTNASEAITFHGTASVYLVAAGSTFSGGYSAVLSSPAPTTEGNVMPVTSPATGTLASGNHIVIGGFGTGTTGARTFTAGSPFTKGGNTGGYGPDSVVVYDIVSATTSVQPLGTWNGSITNGPGFTVVLGSGVTPSAASSYSVMAPSF